MERKYKVREITPKENMCVTCACPGIYEVEEITSKENMCIGSVCPGIYELTPKEEGCILNACPGIYDKLKDDYLIIGTQVNPEDVGLEKKVGKDEVLISVPKEIIDNRRE